MGWEGRSLWEAGEETVGSGGTGRNWNFVAAKKWELAVQGMEAPLSPLLTSNSGLDNVYLFD